MALDWMPTWQVLAAFGNVFADDVTAITTVASPPGTLGARNVWTDITKYVLDLHTHRGRQHEIDRFESGTANITLWDVDGRFDLWNTASPYNGLMVPGVPIQIRATINFNTYNLYTGYADVWSSQWPDEVHATTVLSCVDAFQWFNDSYLSWRGIPTQVVADGASAYWRLNDLAGQPVAADQKGGLPLTPTSGTPVFGLTGAFPVDPATSMGCAQGSQVTMGSTNTALAGATALTMEAWVFIPAGAFPNGVEFGSSLPGTGGVAVSSTPAAGLDWRFKDLAGNFWTAGPAVHGAWQHIMVTMSAGTNAFYVNGVAQTLSASVAWSNVTGQAAYVQATGTGANDQVQVQELAFYRTALSSGQALTHYTIGQKCVPQQASGQRVVDTLDVLGWPTNARNIFAGQSQMQATTQTLTGTTGLSYLQLVELSENGELFMDGSGKVTFFQRNTLLFAPHTQSQVTFTDQPGPVTQMPFEPVIDLAVDSLDLYGSAQVQRQGGILQSATAATAYTARIYQPGQLLLTTDAEALEYAQWEVAHLSVPVPRVRSIRVHPLTDPTGGTAAVDVLGRELMDRVTVNRSAIPGGGTGFNQQSFVEGIDHQVDFSTGDWQVLFALAPGGTQTYWIWGTSAWDTTPPAGAFPTRWAY